MIKKAVTSNQKQFFSAIPGSWRSPLEHVCQSSTIDTLVQFLKQREQAGAKIYPAKKDIFAALQASPFEHVRVVIVGQDPYHGPGQAHGLSFSVPKSVPRPPSLRNIFKELQNDLGIPIPKHGNLSGWAKQGVLLLNAILTVEEGRPAAHANKGWELFTDAIVDAVIKRPQPTVLMLWGAYAQKKVGHLHEKFDPEKQLVLKAAHPSPLSIRGFLGCHHFSKANFFLKKNGLPEINWAEL